VESFLADRTAETALDVGCGNGRHAELLAERADRVLALDASRGLLDAARERRAPETSTPTFWRAMLPDSPL